MQKEIIVENGIKSILQKIFDYYYSYKRTCKTVALGGLLPIANDERDGLISKNWYISREVLNIESYEDTTILDDLEKCGFYSIVPEIGSWGTLLILYNGSGGRGGCVQILCTIDDITPNYQIRMKRGNDARNWTSWKKIVIE